MLAFKSARDRYSIADLLEAGLESDNFEAGRKLPAVAVKQEEKGETMSLQGYPSYPYINRLRLKYDEEKRDEESGTSMRDYGILMHRAFSEMKTAADLDKAIRSLVLQGFIPGDAHASGDLRQKITEALHHPNAAAWFDGSWEVHTEANILLPGTDETTHQLRPDRVMIKDGKVVVVDYKFGELEQAAYEDQVKKYIGCLQNMGYTNVEGFLWYVSKNKALPVIL